MMLLIGKRKRNKGFLLVEVMVSISILSIGLLLVLNSFFRSIKAVEVSRDYFKAGLLLENKIYELLNKGTEEGVWEGSFDDFNKRFSWNLDAGTIEESPLNEINLKVSWGGKDKEKDISISTYIKDVNAGP